jgi:hypothetical protein
LFAHFTVSILLIGTTAHFNFMLEVPSVDLKFSAALITLQSRFNSDDEPNVFSPQYTVPVSDLAGSGVGGLQRIAHVG